MTDHTLPLADPLAGRPKRIKSHIPPIIRGSFFVSFAFFVLWLVVWLLAGRQWFSFRDWFYPEVGHVAVLSLGMLFWQAVARLGLWWYYVASGKATTREMAAILIGDDPTREPALLEPDVESRLGVAARRVRSGLTGAAPAIQESKASAGPEDELAPWFR